MNSALVEDVGSELEGLREARTYKRFLTLESPTVPGHTGATSVPTEKPCWMLLTQRR